MFIRNEDLQSSVFSPSCISFDDPPSRFWGKQTPRPSYYTYELPEGLPADGAASPNRLLHEEGDVRMGISPRYDIHIFFLHRCKYILYSVKGVYLHKVACLLRENDLACLFGENEVEGGGWGILGIYLSICLSIYPSFYLPIYLSISIVFVVFGCHLVVLRSHPYWCLLVFLYVTGPKMLHVAKR